MDSLSPKNTPPASSKGINPSQPKPERLLDKATVGIKRKSSAQIPKEHTVPKKKQVLGGAAVGREKADTPIPLVQPNASQTNQETLLQKAEDDMMDSKLSMKQRVESAKILFKLQPAKITIFIHKSLKVNNLIEIFDKDPETIAKALAFTFMLDKDDFLQLPTQLQESFIFFWGESLSRPIFDDPKHKPLQDKVYNCFDKCVSHYAMDHPIHALAKKYNKESISCDTLQSLLRSQNEAQFQERFKKIDWTFDSHLECSKVFNYLAQCLTWPHEPSPTNAKRLLEAFSTKGIHAFSCKVPSFIKNLKAPCTGTAISQLVRYFLTIQTASNRAAYLELVRPFITEALQKNPSVIFDKNTDSADYNYWCSQQIVLSCETSTIPKAEWQSSLDFILKPYWNPLEKFILWGNLNPLQFTSNKQVLLQNINIRAGYQSTTKSWIQNFFQEKNLLGNLNATPAYAQLWDATRPLIDELISSFEVDGLDPKSVSGTAISIEQGKATAIGIHLENHFMSMSVMNGLCFINNYGGDFDLKECRIGENALPGTLILKLKDGKKPDAIWTEDQIQGLKSYIKSPEKFQPAIDKIFENYDVVGAYDARGQRLGNCAAKHNFLHIFNALMATAYNMKEKAINILHEFQNVLCYENNTHHYLKTPRHGQTIAIRGQEVPFCNKNHDNPLVPMASICYRDLTLLMRIESLLDVVNDYEGIQKLAQMTNPHHPESVVEEFRTNIRTTTQNLVRLFKKRLVDQSGANKGLKLHEVGLNTLCQKDGKPFALVPYILENLNPDSPFSDIVRGVVDRG